MKKKILILYATYGSGHKTVANYIKKYFELYSPDIEVKAADLILYSNSIKGIIGKKISENLMLHHPILWNLIYRGSDNSITGSFSESVIVKPFKNKKLAKELKTYNPDLVIATHFYGSDIANYYNSKKVINAKIISIVTDYEAHKMWLKNFDKQRYVVVSSKEEQKELVKEGYEKEKIKPYGIPIFPVVSESFKKEETLKRLKLNKDYKTCLIFTGGSNGSTGTLPYIKAILKEKKDINLIIVCGRNKKAYTKIKEYITRYDIKNIYTLGFVNNVPELISSADFVITKPGGIQTTECLYFKKPMLLIKSSGGQENANIKHFCKKGYSKWFRTPRKLAKFYSKIENNKELLKMQQKLEKSDNTKSMKKIHELVLKTLKEN